MLDRNQERYDDRLIVRTNLIDAYDLMMGFIEKHLDDPLYLEGDLRTSLREKLFREAVSNIIAHREYTSAAPATIKIYRDRVELENPNVAHFFGRITPDNVRPFPKNPTICKLMIQLGRFDELGSGVINVHRYLPLYANGATPLFQENEHSFVTILPLATVEVTPEVRAMLFVLKGAMTRSEIMGELGLTDEKHFREHYQQAGVKLGLVEMTIPDKPTSRLQKYRLTEKGKGLLARD